jgi:hypothetical protein
MSFTGIGRIGSQHTLTSHQDDDLYLFNSAMWCTHPFSHRQGEWVGDGFDITEGSLIVVSTNPLSSDLTLLCENFDNSNQPYNKYLAYENSGSYGILEVDYVLSKDTLILKYPAFETATVKTASQIAYWETPILKEVEVRNPLDAGVVAATIVYANKYSSSSNYVWDVPLRFDNEGGLEPMLISNNGLVILKY